mgnify:CR=1 FL=1|jgi:hypothetical protein
MMQVWWQKVLIVNATCPQRASKYRALDLGFVTFNHCEAKDKIVREGKKSKKIEAAPLTYY